jgi:hypothetical protein
MSNTRPRLTALVLAVTAALVCASCAPAADVSGEDVGAAQQGVGDGNEPLTLAARLCLVAVSAAQVVGCGELVRACALGTTYTFGGVAIPCWLVSYIGCGSIGGFGARAAATRCTLL